MKYILGICNLIGVILLGYIMQLCFRSSVAAEADYEAQANKYRTENAAQVCYITTLYHFGDWTTILGDVLAIDKIGTALSFEETSVSYIIAFGEGVTAAVEPYTIYEHEEYKDPAVDSSVTYKTKLTKTLTTALDLNSGTYVTAKLEDRDNDGQYETYVTSTTLNIDTRTELTSLFSQLNGRSIIASEEALEDALIHARTLAINRIIRKSMGLSGYRSQDTIYIAAHDNNIPGIRTIENQTVLVLQGTNVYTSSSTTLAGYTKIKKRHI